MSANEASRRPGRWGAPSGTELGHPIVAGDTCLTQYPVMQKERQNVGAVVLGSLLLGSSACWLWDQVLVVDTFHRPSTWPCPLHTHVPAGTPWGPPAGHRVQAAHHPSLLRVPAPLPGHRLRAVSVQEPFVA